MAHRNYSGEPRRGSADAPIRRRRALWRSLAVLLVAALVAGACGDDGDSGDSAEGGSKEPLVLGAVIAKTGAAGAFGNAVQLGIQTALDKVNGNGGLLGRQVKMVVRDSGTETNKGVLAAQDLLDNEKAELMLPDYPGNTLAAILPLTTERKMLTVTNGSCACAGDTKAAPYSFQITVPKRADVLAMMDAIPKLQKDGIVKGNRVGVFTFQDAAGTPFQQAAEELIPKSNFVLSGTGGVPTTSTDYTAELEKLRRTNPNVIVTHPSGVAIITLMNGLRDIGWTDIPVVTDTSADITQLNQQVPPSVAKNLYVITLRAAARDGDTLDTQFTRELEKNGSIDSMTVSAIDHDVMLWLAWGINKAGTLDGDKVRAALEQPVAEKDWPAGLALKAWPGWTANSHTPDNAYLKNLYALAVVSPNVKGTLKKYANGDLVLPNL